MISFIHIYLRSITQNQYPKDTPNLAYRAPQKTGAPLCRWVGRAAVGSAGRPTPLQTVPPAKVAGGPVCMGLVI